MKKRFNALRIGMLGGGQLGRMLLQKAADFSLTFKILDPDPAAPCRFLAEEFVNGSFNDHDTVYSFGKSCDLLTIEIEHVNVEALELLEKEGVLIYPQPHIIKLVQDKGEQKLFYKRESIPTADFEIIKDREDLKNIKLQFPVMQKLRRGGYDGKGVCKISSADTKDGFDAPSVVEEIIKFKKEISVIVARNSSGEIAVFPPVEMEFNSEANLVEFLFAPASISKDIEKISIEIAENIADKLKITGILAVEMFIDQNDNVLVNEIAPRPHNSGHHTIEGNVTSQYEQHLRAILGMPLGSTDTIKCAVMLNLLGEKNYDGPACYESIEDAFSIEGVYIHIYGKRFTRPYRKMGHVTVTADNIEEAKEKAFKIKKFLKVISE